MTPERWQRIDHVFHAALERAEDERAAFIVERCAGDASLIRDVEALLEGDDRARDRLQHVVGTAFEHIRPAAPSTERALEPAPVTYDPSLRLGFGGLRFAEPHVEAEYRAWQVEGAIPPTRLGMLTSIVNWILASIGLCLAMPAQIGPFVLWAALVMIPLCIAVIVTTYRSRAVRWLLAMTMLVNALTGSSFVLFAFQLFAWPEMAIVSLVIIAFFGFTIFRLRTLHATVAVLPYVALNQLLVAMWFRDGEVTFNFFVLSSIGGWVAFFSGITACVMVDRLSRDGFRQQRTIEAQRAALERERARVDVAERSRDLFAALSRLSAEPVATRLTPGDIVADR